MHAVVTATVPRSSRSQVFERMRVRVFDTDVAAAEWATLNPHYVTEVVPVEVMPVDESETPVFPRPGRRPTEVDYSHDVTLYSDEHGIAVWCSYCNVTFATFTAAERDVAERIATYHASLHG
jgi:hypothetical protein